MDTAFMNPHTALIAVRLQLADIDDLLDNLYDDTEIPDGDARLSFQVLRRDLQHQLQVLEGQVLALKILANEHENAKAFQKLIVEEKRAVDDHKLAMQLAGLAVNDPVAQRCADYEASLCDESVCDDDAQWDMAKELYASAFEPDVADRAPRNGIRTATAADTTANTKSRILNSKQHIKCNACMELVLRNDTLTLRCEPEPHTYCRTCLVDLFSSAIVNTSLFPPRCCKVPIPLDICRTMLPKKLIKDFDLKVEELATPNPTYCSNADCSKFIRPNDIKAEVGNCVYCKDKTCVRCKGKNHEGLCPHDPHVQLLMDAAKRGKWQQCTRCRNMVELAQGCFHMR
ncbi:hypothetical protein N0V83_010744 [Neocucurbitaria cava]|uniref:RBR-type E3 ubiquitin transferase n=1 Tax=Neocucurbitaria cava TaxID=798079 RepID=A0A9W8XXT5_9PLEO|nr:hypothetical protein N0V83_010744 [Neocucurbitaria cava]